MQVSHSNRVAYENWTSGSSGDSDGGQRIVARAVNVGIAFVASSALIRGLVRAVLHLQPLAVPYASFSELESGVAWARTRTYDAGVSLLPPRERLE